MDENTVDGKPMPTIWEIPDDIWPTLQRILDEHYPAKPKGHRRVDLRRVFNGSMFRLRTGCQGNHLPKPLGDDSTVHRHCQPWCQHGLFERLWAELGGAGAGRHGGDGHWQAAAAMGKARMGGDLVGRNPPDRGKTG